MHTFEVRVCTDNRWVTELRCSEMEEALQTGRLLSADHSQDGVKVIAEIYDEDQGVFKEKVLFSYFNQERKKAATAKLAAAARFARKPAPRPRPTPVRSAGSGEKSAWMLVAALVLGLGINVGLAFIMGKSIPGDIFAATKSTYPAEPASTKQDKLVVYDLPTVTMSYGPAHSSRKVKVKLGLELNNRKDIGNIQKKLAAIISTVADDLSSVENEALYSRDGLEGLRNVLHRGIQTAAGSVQVEGVLFKDILVF